MHNDAGRGRLQSNHLREAESDSSGSRRIAAVDPAEMI
jgi:hypothetical protein